MNCEDFEFYNLNKKNNNDDMFQDNIFQKEIKIGENQHFFVNDFIRQLSIRLMKNQNEIIKDSVEVESNINYNEHKLMKSDVDIELELEDNIESELEDEINEVLFEDELIFVIDRIEENIAVCENRQTR